MSAPTDSNSNNGKPIIGVIGATGMQGNGLVRAICNDKDSPFRARAFTRDTTKDKAKELEKLGAEVAELDLNKPDSLYDAFQGLTGLYVVTAFWEYMDANKEAEHVKAIVAAGEKAGIEHYVWSTFDDTTPFYDSLPEEKRVPKVNGYYTPHVDVKGQMNQYFPKEKTTFLVTSFYFENLYVFGFVQNGVLTNNQGSTKVPLISHDDIGACAYGVFKAGSKYRGEKVCIAGDIITFTDLMKIVSEETGKEYKYQEVDRDTYAGFGFPGSDDLANMFEFQKLNHEEFCKKRDLSLSKELNPNLMDARAWVKSHLDELQKVGPE